MTVVDRMGKTVEKGEGCTDDIFRSTVLAYAILIDPNYSKLFGGFSNRKFGGSRLVGCRATGSGNSRCGIGDVARK